MFGCGLRQWLFRESLSIFYSINSCLTVFFILVESYMKKIIEIC